MSEPLNGVSLEAALTVASLERSTAWYVDVLGFSIDRRHERGGRLVAVSLQAGAVRLLLTQDDGAKGTGRVKGEGFSLQITTRQSADDIAARIKAQGGVLDTETVTAPWGVRIFRVRDPDGFRITISSANAA
jgi:catechol 2,3-dioxygenase-like lactoylglutathione lyase family enzyme